MLSGRPSIPKPGPSLKNQHKARHPWHGTLRFQVSKFGTGSDTGHIEGSQLLTHKIQRKAPHMRSSSFIIVHQGFKVQSDVMRYKCGFVFRASKPLPSKRSEDQTPIFKTMIMALGPSEQWLGQIPVTTWLTQEMSWNPNFTQDGSKVLLGGRMWREVHQAKRAAPPGTTADIPGPGRTPVSLALGKEKPWSWS